MFTICNILKKDQWIFLVSWFNFNSYARVGPVDHHMTAIV